MHYGHEWLMGVRGKLLSAKAVIPVFEIGDDDPAHIKRMKEQLQKLEYDTDKIITSLYDFISKAYKDEYGKPDKYLTDR